MKAYRLIFLSILTGLTVAACGERSRVAGGTESPPDTTTFTAAAESSGDWCGSHGVPESACTKCNPELIPEFQARGDWCPEHGFPESVCPLCNPGKGGGEAATSDDGPPDGLRVTLESPEVAEAVGIRTVPAIPGGDDGVLVATATLVADNARSALVNPRAAGVIRSFKTEVGARVRPGSPLAEIESAAVAEARARLRAARARAEVADAAHRREQDLHGQGISSQKDAQTAEQAAREAAAEVRASLAALDMIGAGDGESGVYDLIAPIGGTVIRRNFTVGTLVQAEEPVFEIVDTAVLWAEIGIPEAMVDRVAPGHRVVLEVDALPGREFGAVIQYVAPVIDPVTRTARARARLANDDGVLRANVYARARVFTKAEGSSALVPREAVQDARGVQVLFVAISATRYETRRVRAIPSDDRLLAVTSGLRPGESVVTDGSFLLMTETLKESIGAGCCDLGGLE